MATKKTKTIPTSTQKHSGNFVKKLFITLAGVLLVYTIFWVGTEIRNNLGEFNFIGVEDRQMRTISMEGVGEITAAPTIAKVQLGLVTEAETVVEAQQSNAEKMNVLQDKLLVVGVEEVDIQTIDFSLYPLYKYEEGERTQTGYAVNHMLEVKIRDLDRTDEILQVATTEGANQISGIDFSIEDKDELIAKARIKALNKAHEKMWEISKALGVRIKGVVGFNEYVPDEIPPFIGGMELAAEPMGSGVSSGSKKVKVIVTVEYEIK